MAVDVVTIMINAVEKVGKDLIVVYKENVLNKENGFLNVSILLIVEAVELPEDVVMNGTNVVENTGLELIVVKMEVLAKNQMIGTHNV